MAHEPGEITLVPTGGLTNIALAVRKEPRIVERVKEVVLMGGGYHEGNWSAVAEFNIIIDPEAAHIVFNERVAGDDGRAGPDPPGAGHPGGRREDRRGRHHAGQFVAGAARLLRAAYKDARASTTRRSTTRARWPT